MVATGWMGFHLRNSSKMSILSVLLLMASAMNIVEGSVLGLGARTSIRTTTSVSTSRRHLQQQAAAQNTTNTTDATDAIMRNMTCSEASKHMVTYQTSASGIRITWDASRSQVKVSLRNATYTNFRMPRNADWILESSRSYFLATDQYSGNMQRCRKNARSEALILVTPLPGYDNMFPDPAASIAMIATRIGMDTTDNQLNVYGWLPDVTEAKPFSKAAVAEMNRAFPANNSVLLDLPTGMVVSLLVDGPLNTTGAVFFMQQAVSLSLGSLPGGGSPANTTRKLRKLASGGTCDALGGDMPNQVISTALGVMSLIPGPNMLSSVASIMQPWVMPSEGVSSLELYKCIEGFVNDAIRTELAAEELGGITTALEALGDMFNQYFEALKTAGPNPDDAARSFVLGKYQAMAGELTVVYRKFANVRSDRQAGVMGSFITFVTTLYLPYYKVMHDSFEQLYGPITSDSSRALRDKIPGDMTKMIGEFKNILNNMIQKSEQRVLSEVTEAKETFYRGSSGLLDCGDETWKFDYSPTLQLAATRNRRFCEAEQYRNMVKTFRSAMLARKGELARAMIAVTTNSKATWQAMVPKSGRTTKFRLRTFNLGCFSKKAPTCASFINDNMPSGHSYDNYNISSIKMGNGHRVDYLEVTYRSRSGDTKSHSVGTLAGDNPSLNIPTDDPIVKAVWTSSQGSDATIVDMLAKAEFTTKSGRTISAGKPDVYDQTAKWSTYSMTDDFSAFKGSIWLCGLLGTRSTDGYVDDIAAKWCYLEAYDD
mmetsp:Transcript_20574/g.45037  ORF Transcript_20574/g.45037 Transcript_20574/m.45037 type:complete len:769 (-) Transcript_20574:681-2987(-)